MPPVGFEPTIPASKRAKTVHASFFYLVCEAIGTAAIPGLLCQPRMIMKMIVEKQMECRLEGETKVLGEKPAPAPLLSITKSHMTRPGPPRGKPATNRLSYGAAQFMP
jgi:hypothetical protein